MYNVRIFFFLFIGVFLLACEGDKQEQRNTGRPSGKDVAVPIKFDIANSGSLKYGDTLQISVSSLVAGKTIDYVEITLPEEKRTLSTEKSTSFKIPTNRIGGGEIRINANVVFTDGMKASKARSLRILAPSTGKAFTLEVVKKYPHDTKSFTQGLLIHEGILYEGTGNFGESRLRKIDLNTGKVLLEKPIDEQYFGEGITIFNNRLYQLTYKSTKAFAYRLSDFGLESEFNFAPYTGEGWGLTHNDTSLIASDGSSFLYFIDPNNFQIQKRIRVFSDQGEIQNLNELEFYKDRLYANVYTTSQVVVIDPETGMVLEVLSARGIVDQADITSGMDVLNGIAINPLNGNLLLTGKYWSRIYEVRPVAVLVN